MPDNQSNTIHFELKDVDYTIPYEQQPECKRHVIGAYANLARHNLTLVVNTILHSIGKETYDEEKIGDAFGSGHCKELAKLDNIQKVNLQKKLYRHFTFLKRMELVDDNKKTVSLPTLLKTLSDFTTCISDIRNFYTHYRPYDTENEKRRQLELKKRMGKRLTYLFENSCQLLKSREELKHEKNEVFYTQREKVEYVCYWFVEYDLPRNYTLEQLKNDLQNMPNHKRRYSDRGIEYSLSSDGSVKGIIHSNGHRKRYIWKTNEDEQYKEAGKFLKKGFSKKNNVRYSQIGEKGIMAKWTQFDRNPDYYASMSDPIKGLSDVGLVYLLCLFLDKSTAFELMEEVGFTDQCTFTQNNAGESLDILMELMCMNRIRMVKSKLDSEMSETALALDMLNELRKCPKQLYNVFSKEARAEFKDDTTVDWETVHQREAVLTEETLPVEDESEAEGDVQEKGLKNAPKSTFVRWEDRFPQMALRYIDERGLFEDIRFQLNLGKYRFSFYTHKKKDAEDKGSIDNKEPLRILQKELHGFGRIQEVELKVKELWQDLYEKRYEKNGISQKDPDVEGQKPYITEQKPQYAIDDKSHCIGLRWEEWDNECRLSSNGKIQDQHLGKDGLDQNKMFIPYIPTDPTPPSDDKRQKNQAEKLLPPQAMLSLYELPALLFYQYLLEKYGKDFHIAEQIIKDRYIHLVDFFNKVGDGSILPISENQISEEEWTNLTDEQRTERKKLLVDTLKNVNCCVDLNDIPDKLRKYLLKVSVDMDKRLKTSAYHRLEERRKSIKQKLESYRKKAMRIGTKDNSFDTMHATLKTGTLAQLLMQDIMDWLPTDSVGRQRLTGQYYMSIQTAMAMLGQEFENESGKRSKVTLSSLKDMMIQLKVIDERTEKIDQKRFHPFLHLVFRDCKEDSIEEFFELYMQKETVRIRLVEEFLDHAKDTKDILNRYRYVPFLHHDRERWSRNNDEDMRKLALGYLKRQTRNQDGSYSTVRLPLQLPNGLFANSIFEFLKNLTQNDVPQGRWEEFQNKLSEAENGKKDLRLSGNVSYLINLFFNYIEDDHAQPFYSTTPKEGDASPYRHVYRIFKKYFGELDPDTNQKTTPSYTVEEINKILSDKKNLNKLILENIKDKFDKFKKEKNKEIKKFENEQWKNVKNENATGVVRRNYQQRQEEVERRMKEKQEVIKRETLEYKNNLINQEKRLFKKVADNERTIRRIKTQDILLLIMARQILKAKSDDREFQSGFCLKHVMSGTLLDKPIDFEWTVNIGTEKKNEDGKIEKKIIKKSIRQEGMKMKDYGQFYKFLSDKKRLATLLSRLPALSFLRAEIENEFAHYDSNRSKVFRLVYLIEHEAYKLRPDLENDANAEPKIESNDFYFLHKNKLIPKRNNFSSLLKVLVAGKDGVLDNNEQELLQSIRNSFSHNTYEVDLPTIFEGKTSHMKIPEVADGILSKINMETTGLKQRLSK